VNYFDLEPVNDDGLRFLGQLQNRDRIGELGDSSLMIDLIGTGDPDIILSEENND